MCKGCSTRLIGEILMIIKYLDLIRLEGDADRGVGKFIAGPANQ
jgi:hypothetical protein